MKRKKPGQDCVPLQVVRNLTNQVPDIWERVEKIRDEKKTNWAEWCYFPMKEGVTMAYGLCGQDQIMSSYYGQQICALAPWRVSKELFIMDPQLEEELCKQENLSVPAECLMRLPYQCFYIQFQSETLKHFGYDGVFVHLNDELSRGHELRLLFTGNGGVTTGFPISLTAKTVTESFQKLISLSYENINRVESKEVAQFLSDRVRKVVEASTEDLLQKTLQLVLYLCAENAELVPEPSGTGREETPARPLKDVVTRKDRYSDVRKWDVGVRIGTAIRKYRSDVKTENPASSIEEVEPKERTGHASPRPHMRRGHWHHFWTGARKDTERKLVLRWIPPTFIGKDVDTPVVLHYEK